ncbi:hypothetical protein YC2023_119339 [Brassica napus]
MENGTLKDHLNDSDNPRLSWRQKHEICAKGLHYLHTGSARATIHFNMLKELYSLHNVIISLQAIEALDPNHKLGTGTTRSKLNLNRKKLHIIKLFREFNQRKILQNKFDVIKAQRATPRQQE